MCVSHLPRYLERRQRGGSLHLRSFSRVAQGTSPGVCCCFWPLLEMTFLLSLHKLGSLSCIVTARSGCINVVDQVRIFIFSMRNNLPHELKEVCPGPLLLHYNSCFQLEDMCRTGALNFCQDDLSLVKITSICASPNDITK